MSKIPENLYYTSEHEWVKVEGNIASVGITDFAQNSLGEIVFVELTDS
jgi:glycine cleavage system H protein